jgi:DNA-binding transcriptional LysR family regulator
MAKGKSAHVSVPAWTWLELRQLQYMVIIADEQSMTRAADRLGLFQSALSRRMSLVEKKLGFLIFDRKHQPLKLTAAGQEFLSEARQLLIRAEAAVDSAYRASRGETGRLVVGINTSIANSKLPNILRAFQQQFPNVDLTLKELASYDQIKLLKSQQLDIGFFHLHNLQNFDPDDQAQFETLVIEQEPLVLVLPEQHRLAKQKQVSLAILAQEKFVLPPSELLGGLRDRIDQLCLQAGFKPKVKQEATWISTVLGLVSGGVGISLLPANAQNLQRTGVVYRALQGESFKLESAAIWRKDNLSVVLNHFLTILRQLD